MDRLDLRPMPSHTRPPDHPRLAASRVSTRESLPDQVQLSRGTDADHQAINELRQRALSSGAAQPNRLQQALTGGAGWVGGGLRSTAASLGSGVSRVFGNAGGSLVQGVAEFAADTVEGVTGVVAHPLQTAKGAGTLLVAAAGQAPLLGTAVSAGQAAVTGTSYAETKLRQWEVLGSVQDAVVGDFQETRERIGLPGAIASVALDVVGLPKAAVGAVSKVGKVAHLGGEAARVGRVADNLTQAGRGAARRANNLDELRLDRLADDAGMAARVSDGPGATVSAPAVAIAARWDRPPASAFSIDTFEGRAARYRATIDSHKEVEHMKVVGLDKDPTGDWAILEAPDGSKVRSRATPFQTDEVKATQTLELKHEDGTTTMARLEERDGVKWTYVFDGRLIHHRPNGDDLTASIAAQRSETLVSQGSSVTVGGAPTSGELVDFQKALDAMPGKARAQVSRISLADSLDTTIDVNEGVLADTMGWVGKDRNIVLSRQGGNQSMISTLHHELVHTLDRRPDGKLGTLSDQAFWKQDPSRPFVSNYARTRPSEDLAETGAAVLDDWTKYSSADAGTWAGDTSIAKKMVVARELGGQVPSASEVRLARQALLAAGK